eukprot:8588993-Karenia_brevis.AAC.1
MHYSSFVRLKDSTSHEEKQHNVGTDMNGFNSPDLGKHSEGICHMQQSAPAHVPTRWRKAKTHMKDFNAGMLEQ